MSTLQSQYYIDRTRLMTIFVTVVFVRIYDWALDKFISWYRRLR